METKKLITIGLIGLIAIVIIFPIYFAYSDWVPKKPQNIINIPPEAEFLGEIQGVKLNSTADDPSSIASQVIQDNPTYACIIRVARRSTYGVILDSVIVPWDYRDLEICRRARYGLNLYMWEYKGENIIEAEEHAVYNESKYHKDLRETFKDFFGIGDKK